MVFRPSLLWAVLPAVAAVGVEWGFWHADLTFSDFGASADAVAILGAFLVGFAFRAFATKASRPGFSVLARITGAALATIPAAAVATTFALVRLDSQEIAPFARMTGASTLPFLVVAALPIGGVIAAVCVLGAARVTERALGGAATASTAAALTVAVVLASSGREPFEALHLSDDTRLEKPSLTLPVHASPIEIDGVRWEYAAVGETCVFLGPPPSPAAKTGNLAPIPTVRLENGFAVCPELTFHREPGRVLGVAVLPNEPRVVLGAQNGVVLPLDKRGSLLGAVTSRDVPDTEPFVRLDGIRAQESPMTDESTLGPWRVERTYAGTAGCRVVAHRDGDTILQETYEPSGRDGKRFDLCPGFAVVASARLGFVSVYVEGWRAHLPKRFVKKGSAILERLRLVDFAGTHRSPFAYRALALFGAVLGLSLLAVIALASVRRRDMRGFAPADHEGGGVIQLEDGLRVRVDAARGVATGRVMVRGPSPAPRTQDYRGGAEVEPAELEVRPTDAFRADADRLDSVVSLAALGAALAPIAFVAPALVAIALGFR